MQIIEQFHPSQKVLLDSTGSEWLSSLISNERSGNGYAIYNIRDQRQRNHFWGGGEGETKSLTSDMLKVNQPMQLQETFRNSGLEFGRNQRWTKTLKSLLYRLGRRQPRGHGWNWKTISKIRVEVEFRLEEWGREGQWVRITLEAQGSRGSEKQDHLHVSSLNTSFEVKCPRWKTSSLTTLAILPLWTETRIHLHLMTHFYVVLCDSGVHTRHHCKPRRMRKLYPFVLVNPSRQQTGGTW